MCARACVCAGVWARIKVKRREGDVTARSVCPSAPAGGERGSNHSPLFSPSPCLPHLTAFFDSGGRHGKERWGKGERGEEGELPKKNADDQKKHKPRLSTPRRKPPS